jgi:hypothetical protein
VIESKRKKNANGHKNYDFRATSDEEVFVYHGKFYAKVPPSSSLIIYQLS